MNEMISTVIIPLVANLTKMAAVHASTTISPPTPQPQWWGSEDPLQLRLAADAGNDSGNTIGDDSDDPTFWWRPDDGFVPPPPRPLFLDESIATDGLTTCDMCTWAWQRKSGATLGGGSNSGGSSGAFGLDATIEAPGELSWVFTLVIVSLISAFIGAIVMIVVLHCKSRIKSTGLNDTERNCTSRATIPMTGSLSTIRRPPLDLPSAPGHHNHSTGNHLGDTNNKTFTRQNEYHLHTDHYPLHHYAPNPGGGSVGVGGRVNSVTTGSVRRPNGGDSVPGNPVAIMRNGHHDHHTSAGVWAWLTRRCLPAPLGAQCAASAHAVAGAHAPHVCCYPAAENHYTHMEETYSTPNNAEDGPNSDLTNGEALYAELDRESTIDHDSNLERAQTMQQLRNVAYQNSAYTDPDVGLGSSSTPSSAYYSDLSVGANVATIPASALPTVAPSSPQIRVCAEQQQTAVDRAYEVVGLRSASPLNWDSKQSSKRLSSIHETAASNVVPSDYV